MESCFRCLYGTKKWNNIKNTILLHKCTMELCLRCYLGGGKKKNNKNMIFLYIIQQQNHIFVVGWAPIQIHPIPILLDHHPKHKHIFNNNYIQNPNPTFENPQNDTLTQITPLPRFFLFARNNEWGNKVHKTWLLEEIGRHEGHCPDLHGGCLPIYVWRSMVGWVAWRNNEEEGRSNV